MSETKDIQEIERVGGDPAVDFVNTVHNWRASAPPDYLDGMDDFIDWALDAGLMWPRSAARFKQAGASEKGKVFRQVIELRDRLHTVLAAMASGKALPQDSLDYLNELIRRTATWRRLSADADAGCKTICCTWDFTDAPLIAALGPVAWAAADFLENGRVDRLKECPGEDCGWIFVDSSKNRSRNWCSMKTCGNQAKVKRFRRKQA